LYFLLSFHYDGKGIGAFQGDTSRNITGSFGHVIEGFGATGIFSDNNGPAGWSVPIAEGKQLHPVNMNSYQNYFPTSHEFRSASISALVCISY